MDTDKKNPEVNTAPSASESVVGIVEEVTKKPSFGKNLLYHLWDADQHLNSEHEKRLVRKLDFGILICSTLGWWMKYIDQSNLTNAYVSGMKEDLKIEGNEYTYMLMCYTIAFAIMQIPSNMIALKLSPRICLVICELGWTAFTFAQAAAQNSSHMYAFRFMIGLFESGFSPIIIFLLGCWYTKTELAKRVAIWHITGFFGTATSGFLQAAVYNSLDGHLGLPGWRWMYIICGCMSLPVALSVWWLLPDYPHNTKAWYLTEEDKQLAIQRAARQGKAEVTGVMDLKLVKRMFGNWRWWVLVLMYIFYGNSCQANNYFSIYLSPLLFTTVIGSSILTAWPEADASKIAGFFLVSGGYVTATTWTWANELNNGNAQERALTISSMNGIFYATNSLLPILIFPQTTSPKFERGFPTILAFALMAILLVFLVDFLHKRQLRQEAQAGLDQPPSETIVVDPEYEKTRELHRATIQDDHELADIK